MSEYLGNGMFSMAMDSTTRAMPNVTPQQVRDIVAKGLVSSGPGVDPRAMPTQDELEDMLVMMEDAVTQGRLIDFGYWPNEQIKINGARGGKLYNQSALGHPFSQPYIIMHSWSDPDIATRLGFEASRNTTCVYLVNPIPEEHETCINFEACALEVLEIEGEKHLCVGDRVNFIGSESRGSDQFFADIVPYANRWKLEPKIMEQFEALVPKGASLVRMAASNVLDPIMMALLILNTRGVQQEIVTPGFKLNRARIKSGKPPIPSYRRVNSSQYITALQNHQRSRPSQGGTHASPVAHIRMGHWRRLDKTRRTFIRDTLVNASPEMRNNFKLTRSHYKV